VSREAGTHLLRYDREDTSPIDSAEEKALARAIRLRCDNLVSGIVIEDYGKGVVTPALLRLVSSLAEDRGIPVFIDPKKYNWEHFRGAELVTPNLEEAYAALGMVVGSCSLEEIGERLLKLTRAKAVIVTQGARGMSLFTEGEAVRALPREVAAVDVSGAGDTAMVALSLSRMAGATWPEAMKLANTAAGVVVGKSGTATVSPEELLSAFV
jgi:D-beta-D-heptose 7-phosphate kinase/D-beta-D-heptose 1-phosphate adenosyltransferase